MQRCYVDFETRSEVDLLNSNASVYARHPSTSILCCVLTKSGKSVGFTDFARQKEAFLKMIDGCLLVAHNAQFEELLWRHILVKKFGYPEMPFSRWRCTMAKLLSHGLPRSLEKGGDALGLTVVKDIAGKKHMLAMCKPGGSNKPEDLQRLVEYCAQDNYAAQAIDELLPDLSPDEQLVWELDQEINFRGVKIDTPLVKQILQLLEQEKEELLVKFREATNGEVDSPSQRQVFKDWLKDNGLDLPDLTAKTVASIDTRLLARNISDAIEIRKTLSKTSNAKYERILNEVDNDGRLRLNLIYHAASTGRWGGAGSQLQNLPRPARGFDPDNALKFLSQAGIMWPDLFGSVADASKSLIRSVIIPASGKTLIGGDFSGIEARITAWIAGQDDTLDVFRRGEDIYCYEATKLFGRTITKNDADERQVGKAEVLAFGYQGGIAAIHKIAVPMGISLEPVIDKIWASATDLEKQSAEQSYTTYQKAALKSETEHYDKRNGMVADIIKQRWRASNPKIVSFWTEVNAKAMEAVTTGGVVTHGPNNSIQWYVEGLFLYCQLPSGRRIAYYKPRVERVRNKFGTEKETLTYLSIDSKTKQLLRRSAYGGLLTENLVQAIARDVMVAAMINVKNDDLNIVLTVHDELLLECEPEVETDRVVTLMTRPIPWALDLPLAVSLRRAQRYGK